MTIYLCRHELANRNISVSDLEKALEGEYPRRIIESTINVFRGREDELEKIFKQTRIIEVNLTIPDYIVRGTVVIILPEYIKQKAGDKIKELVMKRLSELEEKNQTKLQKQKISEAITYYILKNCKITLSEKNANDTCENRDIFTLVSQLRRDRENNFGSCFDIELNQNRILAVLHPQQYDEDPLTWDIILTDNIRIEVKFTKHLENIPLHVKRIAKIRNSFPSGAEETGYAYITFGIVT